MKIAEVADRTGISKELIHHYLRQGLLPKSSSRALYSEQQFRLLALIKVLREDHHLPLEVIRGVFKFFAFDPGRIAALTHADSLLRRMTRLVTTGDMLSSQMLPSEDLIRQAGITSDRLAEYVEARLVRPVVVKGRNLFSAYEVKVITLCEQGARLGMPFESLKTIGSYVRVAFEVERPMLLDVEPDPKADPQRLLSNVIARLEVITSFIQSFLQSLMSHHLRDVSAPVSGCLSSLDGVIYRPSASFVRRYRLDQHEEAGKQRLCDAAESKDCWIDLARIMLHAGHYGEAVFFLDQALERWPGELSLRSLYARALLLSGQMDRAAVEFEKTGKDPICLVYRSLCQFVQTQANVAGPLLLDAATSAQWIEQALAAVKDSSDVERFEIRMLGGWQLTALPKAFRQPARGLRYLADTLAELTNDGPVGESLPGLRQHYLVNAAYLLFDGMQRCVGPECEALSLPSVSDLCALVCRLDPGCDFAESIYLQEDSSRAEDGRLA